MRTGAMALSLAVVLSGCLTAAGEHASPGPAPDPTVADTDDGTGRATSEAPTTIPWDLIRCDYAYASANALASRIRPHLSAGFEPVVLQSLPNGDGLVRINFEVDVCEEGAGLHGPVAGMTYAHMSMGAVPPDALRIDGVPGGYFQSWDQLIPDDDRRALLASHGMDVHDGTIDMTTLGLPGDQTITRMVDYTLDGLGDFRMSAVVQLQPAQPNGHFIDYDPAGDHRVVMFRTDWQAHTLYQGPGTVTLPLDSWMAGVFGTPVVAATFLVGSWSYTDGTITYPIDYE